MNHCNCFNGLINQVIYLDDTSDVHLEIEGFRKQGQSDSLYGRTLVVDAHDFVDEYVVIMRTVVQSNTQSL